MAMRPKLNAQPNKSLIDGIATLQALATSPDPVGCRELARRLNIDSVKVNRLLKTLAYLGIARQTADRKYTAGPGMHVLAAQSLFASGLIRNALPVLESLRRFGHTVALGVLWQDNVSYSFHAPPGIEASRGLGRIGLLPATTSGIGVVLLSEHEDDDVRELYRDRDIPMFPEGIDQLLAKLAEVRSWVMRASTLPMLAIITSSRCRRRSRSRRCGHVRLDSRSRDSTAGRCSARSGHRDRRIKTDASTRSRRLTRGVRVSKLRWAILAMLFAATVLNYVDRQTLSILASQVQKDLGIDDVGYARIVQYFLIAYATVLSRCRLGH